MTHNEYLIELGACEPARLYAAEHPTLKAAWDACTVPDWLIWLAISAAYARYKTGSDETKAIGNTCHRVYYLSCDQIRAALSCPEVPK